MPPYAELHCRSNFSFLEGASHPDELMERAAELSYRAIAITDRHTLAGIVRAHGAAKPLGLKLLVGAELIPIDAPALVVWAINRRGYAALCQLLTLGKRRADKGDCHLLFADLATHAEHLLAGVPLVQRQRATQSTAKLKATDPADAAWHGDESWAQPAALHAYREVFGDRLYALAELHRGADDRARLERMANLAAEARLPLTAAGDVHYHIPQRQPLSDLLCAVRWGCTVAELGQRTFPNRERHLQPLEELAAAFRDQPAALARTCEVADRCQFSLDELRYEYPEELVPAGETPLEFLKRQTYEGARQRYPQGIPDHVQRLLNHELTLIEELRYEPYFLTVWDLVRFARSREILCQGRGSAANSAVCYCLGVTSVDPDRLDVLFERFISRERNEAPDIDIDFEHERREEVLQYIYDKYGRDRAAMTAEVITYCGKSAVRDVGKALGLSPDRLDQLAKHLEGYRQDPDLEKRFGEIGLDCGSTLGRQLVHLTQELIGFPRHLSQHVGGMVITCGPLCELVPIENAAMPGRTVIEWNKDDLDELGILKVDCLALGMLTAIRKCFALIQEQHQRSLTLATVPEGDQQVYDMICQADTMGVFQIESRAQMSMLPRLKPRCYYDLVIEVAIVRPGPIQGDMVHPYLRRRAGEEKVTYPNDAIRQVLQKTLGVPLFQEQAMKLAIVAAGFTPGEADQLRRAMAAWRRPGIINEFQEKLIAGMTANGLSGEFAQRVFQQIRGFGEYGFPESHAASFALLVYVSAWLKHHYPAEFVAAVVNSQPMGFYAPAQLIRNAREHGVEVRPVDVQSSHWDCTLEAEPGSQGKLPALRLGLRLVAGFSEKHAEKIVRARQRGRFRSLDDFARRTRLPRSIMLCLGRADVFAALDLNRRQALWDAFAQDPQLQQMPLLRDLEADEEPSVELPPLSAMAEVSQDYRTIGLSLRSHPLSFFRHELERQHVAPAAKLAVLPVNKPVRVAGLVLMRQRPSTAKGITFMTLEDETGIANLIVSPAIWQRYHRAARTSGVLLAHGRLERQGIVIHVVVTKLEDLGHLMHDLPVKSRDFH